MGSNNNSFRNKLNILIVIMSSFSLILFFQNCGKNSFQAKSFEKLGHTFENQSNPSELEDDGQQDSAGIDGITDIFNDPGNQNNLENTLVTASTGKILYVSTSGDNNINPGTESKPFRTIAHAVSKMVAGDITYVRGGTYNENVIRFGKSGTASAPIKLLNYPGEKPIIRFINRSGGDRFVVQNFSGYNKAIGWITIEGFDIQNGYNGIKYYNMHNSIIRRNWIRNSLYSGILGIGGHHNLIDRNIVSHNGDWARCAEYPPSCNQTHGIYAHGPYTTITNNLIYNNLAFGIQQNGSSTSAYDPAMHAGPEFAGADNWIVANNTLAYSYHDSGMVVWGGRTNNVKIYNNIFYENAVVRTGSRHQGIEFFGSGGAKGKEVKNNLAYATNNPGGNGWLYTVGEVEGVSYTQSGNIVNTSNPKFVNAPAVMPLSPNFMLTSQSPAINRGLSNPFVTSFVKFDFQFKPRPQGGAYDIGAYEFTGGSL